MAVQGTEFGVTQLTFGHPTIEDLEQATAGWDVGGREYAWMIEVRERLQRYADGETVTFRDLPVEEHCGTPFQQQVLRALRNVDYGQTLTYAELAAAAGRPKAARGAGTVMAKNRIPLLLPCHRIVGCSGRLGGYSAPDGLNMKRRLLELEQTAR